jgi:hypothetical protein
MFLSNYNYCINLMGSILADIREAAEYWKIHCGF